MAFPGKTVAFRTPTGTYTANSDSDVLGSGTYGTVYRIRKSGDPSVVKAVKTFSATGIAVEEGIPATTLRELNAMRIMNHPNIIKVDEVVYPSDGDVSKMFYSMELCQGSLSDKMKKMVERYLQTPALQGIDWSKRRATTQLPAEYKREAKLIIWQLLNGVAYMHSWGITHRDLKPANVMWGFNDKLKIGDFGLARFTRGHPSSVERDPSATHTGEVQTLWYRAPEVILGDEEYGAIVDDWSIGCVMAELFRLKYYSHPQNPALARWKCCPAFAGDGELDTLVLIMQTVGKPTKGTREYNALSRLPYWSDHLPSFRSIDDIHTGLTDHVPLLDPSGIDLLSKLLSLSPGKRCAARYLLSHQWFDDIKSQVAGEFEYWNDNLKKSRNLL